MVLHRFLAMIAVGFPIAFSMNKVQSYFNTRFSMIETNFIDFELLFFDVKSFKNIILFFTVEMAEQCIIKQNQNLVEIAKCALLKIQLGFFLGLSLTGKLLQVFQFLFALVYENQKKAFCTFNKGI